MSKDLTESQEDYLEAIYVISAGERGARSSEISDALGVKRPSVTTALKTLADKGLIHYAPYDRISLTLDGETLARTVVARHGILRQFLSAVLGVESAEAEASACRLEHAFSAPVFARFVQFISALDRCPDRKIHWDPDNGFACGRRACADCAPRREERQATEAAAEGFLKELAVGDTAEIVGYRGESSDYRQKLLAMGLTRGIPVTIIKVAPLGDPVEIEVRGFRLTVRKDEADALVVRKVSGPASAGHGTRHGRGRHGRHRAGAR